MARKKPDLDADAVVAAAFAVLDASGIDGLTMRAIAARLNVANPALYWHFASKQELVDRMAEQLVAQAAIDPRGLSWRTWLARTARAFRDAMRSRRDGARLVVTADLSQSALMAIHGVAAQVMGHAGFRARDALVGAVAVFDYAVGATFEEEGDPSTREAQESRAMFEGGLALILDGLALRLSRRPDAIPRRRRRRPSSRPRRRRSGPSPAPP